VKKLLFLVFVVCPCLGLSALFALSNANRSKVVSAGKAEGAQVVATLEAQRLDGGAYPAELQRTAGDTRLNYRLEPDGGYTLYFSDPGWFILPSDMFWVWERDDKRWRLVSDVDLFHLSP
jgi:hypothetical protein